MVDSPDSRRAPDAPADDRSHSDEAFAFVRELAGIMNRGHVELPSFPAVAARVIQVLNDPSASAEQVVRVLGAEPALAARTLLMANSIALNPAGHEIRDLRMGVLRVGFDVLRSAAVSFAMSQLKQARNYEGLEAQFAALWSRSSLVAATCYATAKEHRIFRPNNAMLAGLLHDVGRLYLFSQSGRYPALTRDPEGSRQVMDEWSPALGKAILDNWNMAEDMVAAVEHQNDLDRDPEAPADLADVVIVGKILAGRMEDPGNASPAILEELPSLRRLRLTPAELDRIVDGSREEIE
ncbi:MAG TPA: HDOD domain-containing protein, partial [Solirubrobacteraceae bacterium]|nr:HDOD domain-containing protein [Solirubrobacteraceae bacterium]